MNRENTKNQIFADTGFLELTMIKLLAGNIEAHQSDATSLVLTRSLVNKYFGDQYPLGQVVTVTVFNAKLEYRIAAVIAELPGVVTAARSGTWPGDDSSGVTELGLPGTGEKVLIAQRTVDEDFLVTCGIGLLAGRNFDIARPTDFLPLNSACIAPEARVAGVIVNQAALAHLDLGTVVEALGKKVILNPRVLIVLTVSGVVENAHFDSLKTALKAEIYLANRVGFRVLGVRYGEGTNPAAPVVDLERLWRTLIPEVPFLYQRLDGVLADQYAREHVQATLLMVFSGVAVLVACLGLFGVSVFIATRRTREVAVRKILGASVFQIVQLLVWQTSKPVGRADRRSGDGVCPAWLAGTVPLPSRPVSRRAGGLHRRRGFGAGPVVDHCRRACAVRCAVTND